MFRKASLYSAMISMGLTAFGSAPVYAEETLSLEEIVVTARRRSENLQEVPISVTVFTPTTIANAGIERPQDFIALTPNMTIVDSANVGDTQVTIRGIVSTRDAESTFAYIVDGVLITNPNGFNEELFDIQQIEVLKGPQGAIYGRNATAGAVLVTSNPPSNDLEGSLKLGAGSNELQKASGFVSGPLIKDTLLGRVALSHREQDGQYDNEFTGESGKVDYSKDDSIRGRLLWNVNDKLVVDTQAAYSEVKGGAINFNAVFALNQAAEFTGNPSLYKDVNTHDFTYIFNVPGENKQETTSFSVKADYELDFATLTTVAAYDDLEEYLLSDGTSAAFGGYSFGAPASQTACTETYNSFDPSLLYDPFYAIQDGAPPGVYVPEIGSLNGLLPPYSPTTCDGYQYQERNQKSASLEMRLTSSQDDSLRWLGGFYVAQTERDVTVSYGADLGLGFDRQGYVPPDGPNPTDLMFSDTFDNTILSAFGQIEYDLNESNELALALRWDQEEREVKNRVPNVLSAQLYGGGAPINPGYDGSGTDTIPDRNKTFSQWQPKLTWRWQIQDDIAAYASYGVGFRSGGFNNLGSAATVDNAFGMFRTAPQNLHDQYDKEVTQAYEIGLKSEWWNRRLQVNAAAFYTEVDDSQFFNFYAGSFGLLRVVSTIDEVHIQGFEVDFQALLTETVTVYGSYGYIDSEIEKNNDRPYTEGNKAPLAPDGTANLGIQLTQPITEKLNFLARLDWRWVGETWFHSVQENTTVNAFTDLSGVYGVPGFGFGTSDFSQSKRDDYDTLNLRFSLESAQWTLTAWGDNITDEDYLEEIIPAPEFGGSFIHPAYGDTYGVDLIYRF